MAKGIENEPSFDGLDETANDPGAAVDAEITVERQIPSLPFFKNIAVIPILGGTVLVEKTPRGTFEPVREAALDEQVAGDDHEAQGDEV